MHEWSYNTTPSLRLPGMDMENFTYCYDYFMWIEM